MAKDVFPVDLIPGSLWYDKLDPSRFLQVLEVNPRDPQLRHIVGQVAKGGSLFEYSCSLMTFEQIWVKHVG